MREEVRGQSARNEGEVIGESERSSRGIKKKLRETR